MKSETRVITTTLNDCATSLDGEMVKLKNVIKNMELAVNDLGSNWKGTDYNSFKKKMTNLIEDLNTMYNGIDKHKIILENIQKKYENAIKEWY